jgi:hypothetical protein
MIIIFSSSHLTHCCPLARWVQFKTAGDGLQSVFANTGIIKDGINIAETFHQQL